MLITLHQFFETSHLGIHPWFGLGYKVLSYDYDKNGTLIDLMWQGPVVGLDFMFF